MRVITASYEILGNFHGEDLLTAIEDAGRTCYKSDRGDTRHFIDRLIRNGHESVLEHQSISVRIICDRGVSHEIVRHRIAAYSQESTRYCNYSSDKFGNEITFIRPCFWNVDSRQYDLWHGAMSQAEQFYLLMISEGAKPQEARSVLPNSLKTEIVCTFNLREWRHFFKLRTSKAAHPQMREITLPMLTDFKRRVPVVFDDIEGE